MMKKMLVLLTLGFIFLNGLSVSYQSPTNGSVKTLLHDNGVGG
ncbi:hypothetical protein SAMN04487970_102640 [Paenibacillus tianmuensis]|uniref:Uncharacterized protein n=1 Tax=Paenibacillus tianmuensis TaxID=624147 RepID=A0A1G4SE96_9BACL|nr:hypothetical protein SAMN04487970_102640 [Paenibacillus tianmuensis]